MEMLGKVRRMHLRDELSLHEISKRTGLSRNTLRKWLRKTEEEVVAPPCYRRGEAPTKLVPYHATLEQARVAAMLVAVELVVESGVLSAEHVENVLARLNAYERTSVIITTNLSFAE